MNLDLMNLSGNQVLLWFLKPYHTATSEGERGHGVASTEVRSKRPYFLHTCHPVLGECDFRMGKSPFYQRLQPPHPSWLKPFLN